MLGTVSGLELLKPRSLSDALRMLHSDEAFQVVGEARDLIAVEG